MISSFCKSVLPSLLLTATLLAQPPVGATPTPSPEEKKPKFGYVRAWNFLPVDAGDVTLLQDNGGEGEPITTMAPSNWSAGYIPLKPARYGFKVVRTADKTPLKTLDVLLRADVYITILVSMKEGAITVEMLDDTYDQVQTVTGKLTVRHLIPGAKLSVTVPGVATSGALTDGAVHVLENLPLRPVMIQMHAALPDGRVRDWNSQINFSDCRHASILLGLDNYKRFRPRIVADGQSYVAPAEP